MIIDNNEQQLFFPWVFQKILEECNWNLNEEKC